MKVLTHARKKWGVNKKVAYYLMEYYPFSNDMYTSLNNNREQVILTLQVTSGDSKERQEKLILSIR